MDAAPSVSPGHLYVVATPIGNLSDLSPRAAAVLAQVSRIAAEDTRTSGILLKQFDIRTRVMAFHEHNEDRLVTDLIAALQGGESLALISDAGTPLINDPGFTLVRAARAAQVPVIAVPGPCAMVAALSISGLPTDRFSYVGFLPPKAGARRARLQELARKSSTLVLYEASHRIVECVDDIARVMGAERRLCLARELTKRFEQSITAPAGEVLAWLQADENHQRGEFVLVIEGASDAKDELESARKVLEILLRELPAARAARVAAEITGAKKNALYALAMELAPKIDE